MILMPDADTVFIDPFYKEPTLAIRCDILDPQTMTDTTEILVQWQSAPKTI